MTSRRTRRAALGDHVLTACGTFKSVRGVSLILGIALVLILVVNAVFTGAWQESVDALPLALVLWLVGCPLLAFLIGYTMRIKVFSKGIEGRSFGGFRRRLLWQNIAGVRFDGVSGIATLVFVEKDTGKELWTLAEIAERDDFKMAIQPYLEWPGIESRD